MDWPTAPKRGDSVVRSVQLVAIVRHFIADRPRGFVLERMGYYG